MTLLIANWPPYSHHNCHLNWHCPRRNSRQLDLRISSLADWKCYTGPILRTATCVEIYLESNRPGAQASLLPSGVHVLKANLPPIWAPLRGASFLTRDLYLGGPLIEPRHGQLGQVPKQTFCCRRSMCWKRTWTKPDSGASSSLQTPCPPEKYRSNTISLIKLTLETWFAWHLHHIGRSSLRNQSPWSHYTGRWSWRSRVVLTTTVNLGKRFLAAKKRLISLISMSVTCANWPSATSSWKYMKYMTWAGGPPRWSIGWTCFACCWALSSRKYMMRAGGPPWLGFQGLINWLNMFCMLLGMIILVPRVGLPRVDQLAKHVLHVVGRDHLGSTWCEREVRHD